MKVLVIGSRIPFPLHDGGAIATYNMLKGLADNGADVTYISLNTLKHFIDETTIKREFSFLKSVKTFKIDTGIKPSDAFMNLFYADSYNIERFYDTTFEQMLMNEIRSSTYNVIHFEGLFVAKYIDKIRSVCTTPALLRQHNIEYRIWERLAENEGNPLKKWYLHLLAKRIKHFEKEIAKKFDRIVTITPTDEAEMRDWNGVKSLLTIPSGFMIPETQKEITPIPDSIYHIGSMEWLPNRQGMEWFHREVWPIVLKEVPEVQFYMAGKNMPEEYNGWVTANFHVNGEVRNANVFAMDKQLLIVPLLSASGIRIKTIEAMLNGKAVVTTTVGSAGLPLANGIHCMMADNASDFAQAIITLLKSPEKRIAMAEKGQKLMLENYEINTVARQWMTLYQSMASG